MSERALQILKDAFPQLVEKFFTATIPLTVMSFTLALIIAVIVAMIQYAHIRGLSFLCRIYIWIIRCTPLLVQLYLVFYGLPSVGIVLDAYPTAVPSGQMEAGYCVSMSYLQTMWHVILPQAFRTAFPALSNSLISMVKGTSLASVITVTEMFRQAVVINGRVYESLALYTEVALIYLAFCSVLTVLQRWGEKKLSAYGGTR